ncbi:MAG TPA: metallophosphoesterase [Steroidobacteraceae bacterium]
MRIFAISDIHVDYEMNARWLAGLSTSEYREDVLIVAGDISDSLERVGWALSILTARFRRVMFVPGNHELWVIRDRASRGSLDKFARLQAVVAQSGASMQPEILGRIQIVPLLGWYDYSFGPPSNELLESWMDFHACRWPAHFQMQDVAAHFQALNPEPHDMHAGMRISFSHFLPRIDLMPPYIPRARRMLYPVLGSASLEEQLRTLKSRIHVYGHSHVNRQVAIDDVVYINNAFGYPDETRISAKELLCIHSS